MPTDIDQQEAHQQLEQSKGYRGKKALAFIHYECGEISKDNRIHAIAIKIPGNVETKLFSAQHGEIKALRQFAAYMADRCSDAYMWCGWNMRNADYGFAHFDARLCELTNEKEGIPMPRNMLDLGNVCWQLHGDISTDGKGKLQFLCERNDIPTKGIADCPCIQDAVKNNNWLAVQTSVQRKVEMIYAVWERMVCGKKLSVTVDKPSKKRGKPKATSKDFK